MNKLLGPDLLWLTQALMVMLMSGLVVALAVGLLLLIRPPLLFAVNASLSRWIDTRAHFRALERPVQLERFFYRHHRLVGAFIAVGAGLVLWRWGFDYDRRQFLAALGRYWVVNRLDWIIAGMEWALVVLHASILLLGLVVLMRPSLLKNIERVANRWHGGPPSEALDTVIMDLDGHVRTSPRLSGFIVALGSSWSLSALLPVATQLLGR